MSARKRPYSSSARPRSGGAVKPRARHSDSMAAGLPNASRGCLTTTRVSRSVSESDMLRGIIWAPYAAVVHLLLPALLLAMTASNQGLPASAVERFANLALTCVHQQYPNKIAHLMQSDADLAPPRELTPAFYGCYDWHSAVHGHWLLARLARLYPDASFALRARGALAESLTQAPIAGDVQY